MTRLSACLHLWRSRTPWSAPCLSVLCLYSIAVPWDYAHAGTETAAETNHSRILANISENTPDTKHSKLQEKQPELSKTEHMTVIGQHHPFRQSADTLSLFRDIPGFSAYSAGGTASLPVLNGMADDRVATFVDGMRLGADCPNHMNPAMSLIDPDQVARSTAIAGITPVSMGGDSTGGTISVERKDPQFASRGKLLATGDGRGDWRSNGGASGASGSVTVANDRLSLRYSASYAHAGNYTAGGRGGHVLSTKYLSYNHAVTAGMKKDNHLLVLTFGQQDVPYEAFPNQYMDETNNRASFVNGKYLGNFSWGDLDIRSFWKRVSHVMNKLSDKGGHSATTGMPMNTEGRSAGYSIKAGIPLNSRNKLLLGSEFEHNGLNDWWPPRQGSMMMGPGTYHNLNGAHRDHLGHYLQWNAQWTHRFSTRIGGRSDVVMMNTGNVAPYNWSGMMNMPDANAARAFNAAKHGRTDNNFDVTALAHWQASHHLDIEGGYARKTRSPNLYERYAWGRGGMSSSMIGWFGDGNGYVGNLNLKPENAHTGSMTFRLHGTPIQHHDAGNTGTDDKNSAPPVQYWDIMVQPFYTYTQNYINVVRINSFPRSGLSLLQFENHRAQSYGINASGNMHLWSSTRWGMGMLRAHLNWVRGQDLTMHSGLYQQMPLNGLIGLYHELGPWNGRVEVTFVKSKKTVDWIRNEPRTPGYALLGLGGGYRWRGLRLDLALENLLNQRYTLPLGGRAVTDPHPYGIPAGGVLAMGRSFNMTLRGHF